MAEIDTTFLTPHPRTVLWAGQRVQCEACANVRPDAHGRGGHGAMRCAVSPVMVPSQLKVGEPQPHRTTRMFCIDAREPGALCGPDASLFQTR